MEHKKSLNVYCLKDENHKVNMPGMCNFKDEGVLIAVYCPECKTNSVWFLDESMQARPIEFVTESTKLGENNV